MSRKKAQEGVKCFEKEHARQKKNYTKVKDLSKKELKARREVVKLSVQKHCHSATQLLDTSECSTSLSCLSTPLSTSELPPFFVAMKFPKRGESSKKRKRRSNDHFYKNNCRVGGREEGFEEKQCNTTSVSAPDKKEKTKKGHWPLDTM